MRAGETRKSLNACSHGRYPGGVCVFVKKDISHAIILIQTTCYGMYFKIDSDTFHFEKDIIIMCVYVPPDGSSFYEKCSGNIAIHKLEEDILNLRIDNMNCDYMLVGDFNSRSFHRQGIWSILLMMTSLILKTMNGMKVILLIYREIL